MAENDTPPYLLDDQVGYLMRLANQRHTAIFQLLIAHDLTPTQFAVMIRLGEVGSGSQNHLGRLTAMDVATVKGVVDRLRAKDLVTLSPDANDARRRVITLSPEGQRILDGLRDRGADITEATLAPLDADERATFVRLLRKLT